MRVKCRVGLHDWTGCRCAHCGQGRDAGHDWHADCERCAVCGARRRDAHPWDGCACPACGASRHAYDFPDCRCPRCGDSRIAPWPADTFISSAAFAEMRGTLESVPPWWLAWHDRCNDLRRYLQLLWEDPRFAGEVLGLSPLDQGGLPAADLSSDWQAAKSAAFGLEPIGVAPGRDVAACPSAALVHPVGDVRLPTHRTVTRLLRGRCLVRLSCPLPPYGTWLTRAGIGQRYWSPDEGAPVTFYAGLPATAAMREQGGPVVADAPDLPTRLRRAEEILRELVAADIQGRSPIRDPWLDKLMDDARRSVGR